MSESQPKKDLSVPEWPRYTNGNTIWGQSMEKDDTVGAQLALAQSK
jgi:hypothetical protein